MSRKLSKSSLAIRHSELVMVLYECILSALVLPKLEPQPVVPARPSMTQKKLTTRRIFISMVPKCCYIPQFRFAKHRRSQAEVGVPLYYRSDGTGSTTELPQLGSVGTLAAW